MRTVRFGLGLAVAATLVACEPAIEPLADTTLDVPAPSFAVVGPVDQQVTGSTGFYWRGAWRTSSLTARKNADGLVTGTLQANYHGLWKDRGRITCFTIIGNEAWLGVVIESSTSPNPGRVGSERILYVQDNGEGSMAEPDRSTGLARPSSVFVGSLDEYCETTPAITVTVHDLEAGNIQIMP